MGELTFEVEWTDPLLARGEELRATWARFALMVDGEPVTRLVDSAARSVRSSVYLPLYPLAEWVATNWWFLFYEIETPERSAEQSYASRHNLRAGSDGYALPSLTIVPEGEWIRLSWRPKHLPHHAVEFVGAGRAVIPAAEVRDVLTRLITMVLRRLEDLGITGTLLHDEWDAILATTPEEEQFCAASAALGADPYALDDESRETIADIGAVLPPSLQHEFFVAANLESLPADARDVLNAIHASQQNPGDLGPLRTLRNYLTHERRGAGPPWQEGYDVARRLRSELGLNGQVLHTMADVGEALSVRPNEMERSILRSPSVHAPFDAVVGVNQAESPGFVVSPRRAEAVKFAVCRGLFEYLTRAPGEWLLVTKARSERQKRNRAFAAEFLVPASSLRARIPGAVVGEEVVDDLAAEFGVASHVVAHQLENHRIARVLPS